MNDGQYTNIRNYLEELASQGRQLLAELQRMNELLASGKSATAPKPAKPTPDAKPAKPSKPAVPRRMGPEPTGDVRHGKPIAEPTEPVEMAVKLPALDPNATQQGTTGKG